MHVSVHKNIRQSVPALAKVSRRKQTINPGVPMRRKVNRRNGDISLDKEAEEYADKIAAARRGVAFILLFWFVVLTIAAWWRS